MKRKDERKIECLVRATIECHIFPDTECFFCGLCDRVRQEMEYYDEYAEELSKSYNNEKQSKNTTGVKRQGRVSNN